MSFSLAGCAGQAILARLLKSQAKDGLICLPFQDGIRLPPNIFPVMSLMQNQIAHFVAIPGDGEE
jgi:hypothetical protein